MKGTHVKKKITIISAAAMMAASSLAISAPAQASDPVYTETGECPVGWEGVWVTVGYTVGSQHREETVVACVRR